MNVNVQDINYTGCKSNIKIKMLTLVYLIAMTWYHEILSITYDWCYFVTKSSTIDASIKGERIVCTYTYVHNSSRQEMM